MRNQMNRAHIVAAHDISVYIHSLPDKLITDKYDVWFCTEKYLFTKEQRALNKQLGVNKVNYTKSNMLRNNSHNISKNKTK